MADVYKLGISCPRCNKDGGVRVVVDDDSDTRIICTKCKKLDVVVDESDAWSCICAIAEVLGDPEDPEVEDVIIDKLRLEE